ncbi:MAG TPA: dTMP kinase [Candidatus Ratteibacteria bacterium]|uniref:Thymidylate kinase n=1 Tax=candidate division TA06 bacterium ADurb.Bin131 TaxID=1852827 RepID=A0A1V6C4K2_UNCT6|nr:MAG: Thymidylate kinase [candidate division TA06 bacterium ADurb.Bin131]HRS05769.1 dTMP kinase [Candidatus Ratteibacteria bacterium]HRV03434.1 dTMP kinase [Candidatus Ratteibacteria bacterium]
MKKKATIVSFEGIDGCGKSTQAKQFVRYLKSKGFKTLFFKEPGTTALGKKLRKILLAKKQDILPLSELFLYLAARNELVTKKIKPCLNKKVILVFDRFIDSTIAYQGYGRGISLNLIENMHSVILNGIIPDITFVIDAPASELRKVIGKDADRLEKSIKFQEMVRRGYLKIAENEPKRVKIIKRGSINETFQSIQKLWQEFFE